MTLQEIANYEYLFYCILSILLGLCFGSLANVLMWRIPRIILGETDPSQSDLVKSSCCNTCHTPLKWYHNIPILSYVFLRGKCGFCGTPISIRYPLVELAGAALGLSMFLAFGLTLKALALFFFVYLGLICMVIDLEHQLLPWVLSGSLAAASLLKFAAEMDYTKLASMDTYLPLIHAVTAALVVGGLFFLLMWIAARLTKKEAMGGGDPPYVAALCLWAASFSQVTTLILIACAISILGSVILRSRQVPFGPGLTLGAFWVVFFPQWVI